MKQSHNLEANFVYDSQLRQQSGIDEDDGLFTSNFIQLLRSEKANNKTLDFNKLYKVIEPYCFSYPLLVHNKSNMINLLLSYLLPNSSEANTVTTITSI